MSGLKNPQKEAITELLGYSTKDENLWGSGEGIREQHYRFGHTRRTIFKNEGKKDMNRLSLPSQKEKRKSLSYHNMTLSNKKFSNPSNRYFSPRNCFLGLTVRNLSQQIDNKLYRQAQASWSNNYNLQKNKQPFHLKNVMTKLFSHQTPHISQRDQRKEPKSYSTYWIEKMKEKKKKNNNLSAHLFQKKEVEIQGTRLYPHDS